MQKTILIVADEDALYTKALTAYLSKERSIYEVHGVTDPEILQQLLESDRDIMLLAGESMAFCCDWKVRRGLHSAVLTEGSRKNVHPGWIAVNKYQKAEEVIKRFEKLYGEETERSYQHSPGPSCRIIGFYGPSGGCLQTSLSLTYAFMAAEKERTLWLSTEAVNGFAELTDCYPRQDVTDLALAAGGHDPDLAEKLRALTEHKGKLAYLPGAVLPDDIWTVKEKGWLGLMDLLRERSDMDTVVWDLGSGMDGVMTLMENCDELVIPVIGGRLSAIRLEILKGRLKKVLADRPHTVHFPEIVGLPPCGLEYQPMEELPYGPLGDFLKRTVPGYGG